MSAQRSRLPTILPAWARDRIEVNTYKLRRFMRSAGEMTPADALVLDAGAGEGRFRAEFAHTKYIGVDLAVGDVAWDYSSLDAIVDLTALPFREGTFDTAVCTQVLEHVPEPGQVLAEIRRALKAGGRLYLSAPQSWHQHQKPHDFYRYTSFGLAYLLEAAGFRVESIENLGGYFWYLSFQLQNFNYWVFSQRPRRWYTLPLRALFGLIFQLAIPICLFYLDRLDPIKDETFGHVCIAVKAGEVES